MNKRVMVFGSVGVIVLLILAMIPSVLSTNISLKRKISSINSIITNNHNNYNLPQPNWWFPGAILQIIFIVIISIFYWLGVSL